MPGQRRFFLSDGEISPLDCVTASSRGRQLSLLPATQTKESRPR
jgi:hypothetical protein